MRIQSLENVLKPYQSQLLNHSLYTSITEVSHLKTFLNYHSFAVWDFMSLLKALQNKLTCTSVPWVPVGHPETRYLINEIVLAEETDLNSDGNHQSHFEMYLDAMNDLEADTTLITSFIANLDQTHNIFETIDNSALPEALKAFLRFTFEVATTGKPHEIAAAFTFGREDLIPNMFTEILKNFQKNIPQCNINKLLYYFERHIELDEDEHGPMALKMITELCGDDDEKWLEVETISKLALEKRIQLWAAIEKDIVVKQIAVHS
ncbi:DUF3050 domain-containing protein [uncultured Winogradskyella sp.]|uniref:DUF3050 domain-containing protein n=1 Tax=uncultured Winogradskyella sp. TaxID=395353 RepID=UPI0030D771F0|tara:strand:+ start:38154 stop:38942 length:789 start_codon:yes stop_codon:yes gene_type:complete